MYGDFGAILIFIGLGCVLYDSFRQKRAICDIESEQCALLSEKDGEREGKPVICERYE